jgi:multidrug resistance efflux pump
VRLRTRKSYVTNLPEGVATRKPGMSLVRWLYFGALIFVLLYLLFYAAQRLFYVEANGYVSMERHLLQTDREGVVRGLTARVGDPIKRGQPLFRLTQEVVDDRRDAAVWERLKMQREIGIKQAELVSLQREIEGKTARVANIGQFKLLELDRDRYREFALLGRELAADRLKADALRQEIAALRSYHGNLRGQEGYRRFTAETPVHSPFDGFIYRVEKGEHEFAHKGDTVLVLEDAGKVRVLAYFNLEDLPKLKVGRQVELILPDGQALGGKIERVDSSSVDSLEKLGKGYQPLEALVRVQIAPLESSVQVEWRRYNQLDVRVRFSAWD